MTLNAQDTWTNNEIIQIAKEILGELDGSFVVKKDRW